MAWHWHWHRHWHAADIAVSHFCRSTFLRLCQLPPFPPPSLSALPLLSSPLLPLLLVSSYLLLTLSACAWIRTCRLQPREVDPLPLRLLVLGHNLILLSLSLFLALCIPLEALRLGYSFWGNAYSLDQPWMAWLIYLFYISKYIEFGDTMIMLLRRSLRQVSFLHVYHHASIALIWWCIAFYAPGGDGYFSAALNSAVHVAMYAYYFLAALIGRDAKLRAKYLFWGRYLTQMQMLQFVLMLLQASFQLRHQTYPFCLALLLFVYMWTLLALFAHFYLSKYISQKPRASLARTKQN